MAKKDAKGKDFGRNNFVNNQQTESYRQQLKVFNIFNFILERSLNG